MKKTLLFGLMAFCGMSAYAQLPNGSTAPDFTATDINGTVHHLQDYLDQGKTVILDVSATWCSPCWSYHNSHALENLYNGYGPNGSNEVMVIFIEGDPATTNADLHGTGGNTQGDWTGGPVPIIDSAEIADLYNIAYFPTVYRICPNGTVFEVGSLSAVSLKNSIQNGCSTPLTGATNHAELETAAFRLCEATETLDFSVDFVNYGKNAITSVVATLKENGSAIATGSLANTSVSTYGSGVIDFSGATLNASSEYTIEFTQINGSTPYVSGFNTPEEITVDAAMQSQNNIQVQVYTDSYPAEMSWTIKDANNNVVASGGPYQGASGGAAGGPDADTVMIHNVTIPAGVADCMTVELADVYGDGWSWGSAPFHGIKVFNQGDITTPVFEYEAGNFGFDETLPAAFKTSGVMANEEFATSKFAVYPNPSVDGIFNFSTQENVAVTVTDLTGKTVFTAAKVSNGGSINLSQLQKGIYIAIIKGDNVQRTEKLVIK